MGLEIERKFLVKNNDYQQHAVKKTLYRQGYLKQSGNGVVRIRIAGENAFITIKGKNKGCVRVEYEYSVPIPDAEEMLISFCEGGLIEKYRYIVPAATPGLKWEIDEFLGDNAGLVIAELELEYENQPFECPSWIGKEVTSNIHYYNSYLAEHPYNQW